MNNMDIYNNSRKVPAEALKEISFGKLKGFSSINPMWQIKQLTNQFGPCGLGWYTELANTDTVMNSNNDVIIQVTLHLFVKYDGEWSKPIEGFGSSLIQKTEKEIIVTNKEALKMARTDALSNACKLLGFGADVYWDADQIDNIDNLTNAGDQPMQTPPVAKTTTTTTTTTFPKTTTNGTDYKINEKQQKLIFAKMKVAGIDKIKIDKWLESTYNITSFTDITKKVLDELITLLDKAKANNDAK